MQEVGCNNKKMDKRKKLFLKRFNMRKYFFTFLFWSISYSFASIDCRLSTSDKFDENDSSTYECICESKYYSIDYVIEEIFNLNNIPFDDFEYKCNTALLSHLKK